MKNINEDFIKMVAKMEKIPPENIDLTKQVLQQIATIQNGHDEFISKAKKEGYDLKNYTIGITEIKFFSLMKLLSEKIGLPVEQYDKAIKDIKIRTFGEEGFKQFFGK